MRRILHSSLFLHSHIRKMSTMKIIYAVSRVELLHITSILWKDWNSSLSCSSVASEILEISEFDCKFTKHRWKHLEKYVKVLVKLLKTSRTERKLLNIFQTRERERDNNDCNFTWKVQSRKKLCWKLKLENACCVQNSLLFLPFSGHYKLSL